MYRSILFIVACGFAVGCHFDKDDDDEFDDEECNCEDEPRRPSSGGRSGTGGASGGSSAASCGGDGAGEGSGGAAPGGAGTGGSATGGAPPLAPCSREADCQAGFNCDLALGVCTPSDTETCGELTTEDACDERPDCELVYAGVNCSCGPGCECVGGEQGCICASFEFFRCEPVE
jgi:hypothetical protein